MNYIFYCFDFPISSKEIVVSGEIKNPYSIALALVNKGHKVKVITNKVKSEKIIGKREFSGLKVYYFRDLPFFGIIRYILRSFVFCLFNFFIDTKGYLKASHSCYSSLLIRNVKYLTPHGTNIPEYKAESFKERGFLQRLKLLNSRLQGYLDSVAMKNANNVLSVSAFQMKEMKEIYNVPNNKMELAYNIPLMHTMNLIYGSEPKKYDIAFVGRLAEKKGLDLFLKIAINLSHLNFILIGGTNFFVTLDDGLVNKLRSQPNIRFLMDVDEWKLAKYLSSSRILIVTSRGYESLPTVILEAIYCGCLPIAPNAWGDPEILSLSENLLYKEGDYEDLLSKISKWESEDQINSTISDLRQKVVGLYNSTLELYQA